MTTHGLHLVIRPSVVVSNPESQDLEINKHDPFGSDCLEPLNCDTLQDLSPPILYKKGLIHFLKDKYSLSKEALFLQHYAYLTSSLSDLSIGACAIGQPLAPSNVVLPM